jgi:hypothetical protein
VKAVILVYFAFVKFNLSCNWDKEGTFGIWRYVDVNNNVYTNYYVFYTNFCADFITANFYL